HQFSPLQSEDFCLCSQVFCSSTPRTLKHLQALLMARPLPRSRRVLPGSYALSGFENVNLFNGNLNFALPMVNIGGRGEADLTMMLTIEQHWRIRKPKPAPNCELTGTCDLRFPWQAGGE
ncbi:MAG TPA: hypothetical protein VGW58_10520, partial [Pyrinomonadaceae bacterium]|nr:hypothetical protein [Pyrinomonadaceae bacterium]